MIRLAARMRPPVDWAGTAASRDGERGVSLTGYALVLGLMVVGLGGIVSSISTGSGQLLVETGNDIGEARADQIFYETTILEEAPAWATNTTNPPSSTTTTAAPTTTTTAPTTTTTTAPPTTTTTAAPVALVEVYEGRVGIDHSGKCLRRRPNNGKIVQASCSGSSDRVVTISQTPDGTYLLEMGGECLAPENDSTGNGAKIYTSSCDPSNPSQQWERVGETWINKASGRCMDVSGASSSNGAELIQWNCHGGANQDFPLNDGSLGGGADPVLKVLAADAVLAGDMVLSTVSGRPAVGTPDNGIGNYSGGNNTGSNITFTFTVTEAGTYTLQGNTIAPHGTSDSFYVEVNGSPSGGATWHVPQSSNWAPRTAPGSYYLEPGEHTVVLHFREDGTWIDGLELVG